MKPTSHHVRPADFEDVKAIFDLIKAYPRELLPRSIADIVQNIDRFIVCERDGTVVGTASWQILPEIGTPRDPSVEIKSVAVAPTCRSEGIGRALMTYALDRVRQLHPMRVIVLTFTPAFFERLGFVPISKTELMHKIYMGCVNCSKYDSPFTCPEVAMSMDLRPAAGPGEKGDQR